MHLKIKEKVADNRKARGNTKIGISRAIGWVLKIVSFVNNVKIMHKSNFCGKMAC